MYYTTFYKGTENEFSIIHEFPARRYAEDMATYMNYIEVNSRPTKEQAETIFRLCKLRNLSATANADTEKL